MKDANLFSASATQTTSVNSDPFSLGNATGFAGQSVWDVTTPAAKTFTATAATDVLNIATHGYALGLLVSVASATTLPGGLAAATDYYVIPLTAGTLQLAASYADAIAGTAVAISDAGTGVHTLTPTALSASVKLQKSVNGSTWSDIADSSQTISADGSYLWEVSGIQSPLVRQVLTIAAGQLTMATRIFAKE